MRKSATLTRTTRFLGARFCPICLSASSIKDFFFLCKKARHIDNLESTGNFCGGWETPSDSASAFAWMQVADGGMESWQPDLKSSPLISTGLRASLFPLIPHLLGVACFKDGFSLPLSLVHIVPTIAGRIVQKFSFPKTLSDFFCPMRTVESPGLQWSLSYWEPTRGRKLC